MIESPIPKPVPRDWSDALLTSESEALLGAVRNYVGPVKTPYDKRDLVAKLEAFLKRAETRASILALLDELDMKVLGSAILLGPVPEQSLKDLFVGEIPLFELGVRIANLLDRLLLFRYRVGGRRLLAVNPLLEEDLRGRILGLGKVLDYPSPSAGAATGGDGPEAVPAGPDAAAAVALFCFLFHTPFSIRKGGGLTKRAAERFAALRAAPAGGEGRGGPGEEDSAGKGEAGWPELLTRALSAAGALPLEDEDERYPDLEAFGRILAEWGEDLPYYLAGCLAAEAMGDQEGERTLGEGGREEAPSARQGLAWDLALVLAGALESLPAGIEPSRSSLARWLRIAATRARLAFDPAPALESLEELGLLRPRGAVSALAPSHPSTGAEAGGGRGEGGAARRGVLVVEGAHAIHLMPEASLEERLFAGCVARPVSCGKVWSLEVERDTVRRAFAAGLSAREIRSRLEALSGLGLPQSFAFSLSAWEEEYRSLRLYRGYVLAVDERNRPVIERSTALGGIVAETLAPGVYFLAAPTAEAVNAALAAAGLEAPPLVQPSAPSAQRPALGPSRPEGEGYLAGGSPAAAEGGQATRRRIDALRDLLAASGLAAVGSPAASAQPDPEPRLAQLSASLAASSRREDERKELAERIERRLVLTERQIEQADPHPERLEAGGLDYLGKVRVVERALRSSGDRLEVLYRLPGADPVRALLRPVKLDKNEKGLVLEAEDLATGGPARVPLGAVSTVRRLRASLFGESQ